MEVSRALSVAEQPFLHDRLTSADALRVLAAEVCLLQAEVERARALKTLGGIPPESDKEWANLVLTPPPTSASDPDAASFSVPGMVSSAQYYKKET